MSTVEERYRTLSEELTRDLYGHFFITRNYFKVHACSRWNHSPIEATDILLQRRRFSSHDVVEIIVWTYDPATRLNWSEPINGYAAKHSIPYNVAVRVVRGANDVKAYAEEVVHDPQVRMLCKKVVVREDPALTAKLPHVRPARVEIRLKSGELLTETVERPRGGFDNPLTETELAEKFRTLARLTLSDKGVEGLEQLLPSLPALADLAALSHLLRK